MYGASYQSEEARLQRASSKRSRRKKKKSSNSKGLGVAQFPNIQHVCDFIEHLQARIVELEALVQEKDKRRKLMKTRVCELEAKLASKM
jgi:hypothetical protein